MDEIIEAVANGEAEEIKSLFEKNNIEFKNEDGTYRAAIDVLNDIAVVLKETDNSPKR